jgi:hypothetical protein
MLDGMGLKMMLFDGRGGWAQLFDLQGLPAGTRDSFNHDQS